MTIDINLKEWSEKTGKTEVELAKAVITLLAIKAKIMATPQRVICYFPKGDYVVRQ